MSSDLKIAKITKLNLGYEDHGILTAFLDLEYGGGAGQGAGGYELDTYNGDVRVPSAKCGAFVMGVLRACGVDAWEKLPGRTIYAVIENGLVAGLRPLPTEYGSEFMFSELEEWT